MIFIFLRFSDVNARGLGGGTATCGDLVNTTTFTEQVLLSECHSRQLDAVTCDLTGSLANIRACNTDVPEAQHCLSRSIIPS